jgi:hypothetical protein
VGGRCGLSSAESPRLAAPCSHHQLTTSLTVFTPHLKSHSPYASPHKVNLCSACLLPMCCERIRRPMRHMMVVTVRVPTLMHSSCLAGHFERAVCYPRDNQGKRESMSVKGNPFGSCGRGCTGSNFDPPTPHTVQGICRSCFKAAAEGVLIELLARKPLDRPAEQSCRACCAAHCAAAARQLKIQEVPARLFR